MQGKVRRSEVKGFGSFIPNASPPSNWWDFKEVWTGQNKIGLWRSIRLMGQGINMREKEINGENTVERSKEDY